MFTIRFIKHGGRGQTSYICRKYETNVSDGYLEVVMTLKDETEYFEQIGPTEPYDIAYVTNEAGRTIDKLVL
jgi:hypothetical protein